MVHLHIVFWGLFNIIFTPQPYTAKWTTNLGKACAKFAHQIFLPRSTAGAYIQHTYTCCALVQYHPNLWYTNLVLKMFIHTAPFSDVPHQLFTSWFSCFTCSFSYKSHRHTHKLGCPQQLTQLRQVTYRRADEYNQVVTYPGGKKGSKKPKISFSVW